MIITNIYGGLGNQMFQYAIGRNLSMQKKTSLIIDKSLFKKYELRDFLLDKFNIKYLNGKTSFTHRVIITNKYLRKLFSFLNKFSFFQLNIFFEREEFVYNKEVETTKNIYFYGYWQSLEYFKDIRSQLIKDFTLKQELDFNNLKIKEEISNCNSVSLHVRRGDYMKMKDALNGHGLCSLEYYNKAIKVITEKVVNPCFYVFSDDIDWVKDSLEISFPVKFINHNSRNPEKDLVLMKHCKHNITANSTFSWWAAWLNENPKKIVLMPEKWMNNLKTPEGLIYENSMTL